MELNLNSNFNSHQPGIESMPESVYKFTIVDPESSRISEVLTLTERQTLHSLFSNMGDKQCFFNKIPVCASQTPHAIAAFPTSMSRTTSSQSGYLERDVLDDIVNVITIIARNGRKEREPSSFAHQVLRAIQKRQLERSECIAHRSERSSRI